MSSAPDPALHETHRVEVRNGVTIAYVREGHGGIPLLLLHGYPETKRIWWRNIGPLAAAGFDVIAPDFRGPRRLQPRARQLLRHRRVLDRLLHARPRRARPRTVRRRGRRRRRRRLFDIGLRYPGFVTQAGVLQHRAAAAQRRSTKPRVSRPTTYASAAPTADYFIRQATEPEVLARRARHARAAAAVGRADVRPPALGHTERVHGRGGRVPQRAVRAMPTSSARAGACTSRARASARWRTCPSSSNAHLSRHSCCTAPKTTWCCRRSRGRWRPRASTALDRCSCPMPGTSCSGKSAETFNKITAAFCRA